MKTHVDTVLLVLANADFANSMWQLEQLANASKSIDTSTFLELLTSIWMIDLASPAILPTTPTP